MNQWFFKFKSTCYKNHTYSLYQALGKKKGIMKFIDWDYLSVGIYIVALNLNLACFFHAKQQISIAIIEIHKENKIA